MELPIEVVLKFYYLRPSECPLWEFFLWLSEASVADLKLFAKYPNIAFFSRYDAGPHGWKKYRTTVEIP